MPSERHVGVGMRDQDANESTEEEMRHSGRQICFHRLPLAFVENAGTDRGGDEHEPHKRCRRGSDEPIEAVVHDRRETGFQGRASRFKPWAALRDLPARKSFCLHLASRQRHHAGNCDCKPATDQNQSAHRGSHWE